MLTHIVVGVVAYTVASRALLNFPELLHRKRRSLGAVSSCRIIGHRGSRDEGFPENTIIALRKAIDAGVDVIELDVMLTKDHKVIVFHDSDTHRMCGCKGDVKHIAFADLPKIIPPKGQRENIGESVVNDIAKIPLFADVLREIPPQVPIIVEFKDESPFLIDLVHKDLQQYSRNARSENVVWFSLIDKVNVNLREKDATLPTINSVPTMLKIFFLYYTGLLPFFPLSKIDILGIPIDKVDYRRIRGVKALNTLPDFVCRFLAGAVGGDPPSFFLAPNLFAHLRRRGIPVWFLGVNDEGGIQTAVQYGATGVLTDRPTYVCNEARNGRLGLARVVE